MFVLIVSVALLLALQLLLALKGAVGFAHPRCAEIAGRKTVD
jgi:hypothetical protein